MIRTSLAAAFLCLFVLAVPLVAQADPPDAFTAAIDPSAVQPPGTGSYTISIMNQPSSPDSATHASIVIPDGFFVVPATTASTSGQCAGADWTATLGVGTIELTPPAGGELCPHEQLALSVTVVTASITGDGTYVWTTTLSAGTTSFTAQSQPTLTIDGTPPDTSFIGSPPATTDASTSFSFTGDDGAGGSGVSGYQCNLDGGGFSSCASPKSYSGLGDGTHTFAVRAVDAVGNVDPSPASLTWTVDAVAPDTEIDSKPPNLSASRTASFGFSGSDSGTGVAGFQCALDGGGFATCASGVTYTGLSDGPHTFAVRAVDAVGNADASPATDTWVIDATPPVPPVITSAPSDPSPDPSWTFEFTDTDVTAHFWCQLDGSGFTSCPSPPGFTTPVLLDGAHTFGVKAIDDAGNPSAVTSYSWTIDTVHPLVSITAAPPLLTNQSEANFSFAANKPGSTYQCALDGGAFGACTSPRHYTGLANGSHTFAVRAISLSLVGPATEYTWVVDTVPPQTSISSTPPADSHSASATFAFASSETASTFTCRLDGGGFTPCTSPKTYSGLGDGAHTFSVQAVDRAGNADSSAASFAWRISGVGPPTQDLTPPRNVRQLKRNVGYGRLQLTWRSPSNSDFDHVTVFMATKRSAPPRTLVYTGKRHSYTNKRFKNGLYYRFVIVSYDHADNASGGTTTIVPPSVLLQSPGEGRVIHAPPRLKWTPVPKATFYNVQIFYRGRKILSAWPAKPRRVLSRRWAYSGHRFSLRRGAYVWYVWPGFGPRAKSRYGQLLGEGTFKVR